MKPQEPIPHNYSMAKLNMIFAISSLVLLFLTFAMVGYDYSRGWKKFQLGFLRLQQDRIQQELQAAKKEVSQAEFKKIDEQIRQHELEIAKQRVAYREAQRDLNEWEGRHYAADQDFRFAKAVLDAMRYDAEVAAQQHRSDAAARKKTYEDQAGKLDQLKLRLEDVTRGRDAARARLDVWVKRIADLEARKKALNASVELLNKQLMTVETTNPQFLALNAPLLDFVSPTLKIDQVVLSDLFLDLNFLRMPRVDRCMTCHRAIDRPGFESKKEAARLQADLESKLESFQIPVERGDETRARIEQLKRLQSASRGIPNPYRTHPKLDSFVGSASPHPLGDFGCTSCHRGLDRATDFARAGHAPMSRKQQKRWIRTLRWEQQPFLETPMHPRVFTEAGCMKCHSSQVKVEQGAAITRGTAMVELYGCYSCHKIDNWRFTNLRKSGPDLNGIAEKTTPQWVVRWLEEPHEFRSTTRMPSFFYQRNMVGPAVPPVEREENRKKQNVEINAIVSYLFANSTRRPWTAGGTGDPARGHKLVQSVGCLGCHLAQETFTGEDGQVRKARRDDFPLERNYGFNLTGTGTKSHPAWLFNWLKNPRNYYHEAPMPDLRLTDQEASDITAYLMTLQKPEFLSRPVEPVDKKTLDDLSRSYLVNTMTVRDADAKIQSMSLNDELVYLGQRSIEKYGCYSCHSIRGFDNLKPIGTELTTEGSKNLHLFDFGFAHEYETDDGKKEHILHTISSFIYNKTRSPRVFDDHREKPYQDKLKMPNFHLSQKEAEAITSVVLGQTKDRVSANRLAAQDSRRRVAEEGRKAISQRNCRACHVVDGYGRAIAETIENVDFLPPDLTPEGHRVQSDWLFNFLKDPTIMTLRPWLSVRMPTFHFSDEEANLLTQSFAAQGNITQFDTTRYANLDNRSVAIGRTVFQMLNCAQCHPAGGAPAKMADPASLAPNLDYSRVRLRHEWVPEWIRRPNEIIPGTRMPTNFPRDPKTGGFTSPLILAIDSPQFASARTALLPQFGSEEAMRAAMSDAVAVSNYLRDYIWSIGSTEFRLARPAPPLTPIPQQPSPRPLITAPLKLSGETVAPGAAPGR